MDTYMNIDANLSVRQKENGNIVLTVKGTLPNGKPDDFDIHLPISAAVSLYGFLGTMLHNELEKDKS